MLLHVTLCSWRDGGMHTACYLLDSSTFPVGWIVPERLSHVTPPGCQAMLLRHQDVIWSTCHIATHALMNCCNSCCLLVTFCCIQAPAVLSPSAHQGTTHSVLCGRTMASIIWWESIASVLVPTAHEKGPDMSHIGCATYSDTPVVQQRCYSMACTALL